TQNLASMIEALVQGNAISFIGPKSATAFIANVPSLRVEKLANSEYQRLHEVMHKPTYFMIALKSKIGLIPDVIKNEIFKFVAKSVC
ncbi:MAG: hypothetical protein ACRCWP_08295, partial [Shewanella sp.]